jgi:dipeptidase E
MKLVFYSGGDARANRALDDELLRLVSVKNPLFAHVPASSYLSELDFKHFVDQYTPHKVRRFLHFPVDQPFDKTLFREVMQADVIHLGGGNTFHFLKWLRKTKMLESLRDYVYRGGILTGLSAGAIMMSRDITTAGFPSFDRDDNHDNLKNLAAMGLVEFDFFPHYRNSPRYDAEFRKLSKRTRRSLYCCPDGAGIVMDGERLTFIGPTWLFRDGKKIAIN